MKPQKDYNDEIDSLIETKLGINEKIKNHKVAITVLERMLQIINDRIDVLKMEMQSQDS